MARKLRLVRLSSGNNSCLDNNCLDYKYKMYDLFTGLAMCRPIIHNFDYIAFIAQINNNKWNHIIFGS